MPSGGKNSKLISIGGIGGSSVFGPANNLFGATSGDIKESPSTVLPAANKAAAELVRDNYFTANPDNLALYDADFTIAIRILYSVGSEVFYNNQHRQSGVWINEPDITGTDFTNISPDHIPAIDNQGQPFDSGIDVGAQAFDFGDKELICKSIKVDPSESINVGPARSNRTRGGYGEAHSNVSGKDWLTIECEIDDTGTKKPTYDARPAKENRVITHSAENLIMHNVTSYTLTPAVSNDVHAIYLKLTNPVTNFRLQIVSNVTGEPIHYYPSELEWRKNELHKGPDFEASEIKLDLSSALAELSTVEITVNLIADQEVNLLGDGMSPWRAVDRQIIATPENLATENYVTAITDNLVSPTWLAVDSVDSNINYGGFKYTGRIRKRELNTGIDTWFQSVINLPVPSEAAWTDWQNRESLIYVEEL